MTLQKTEIDDFTQRVQTYFQLVNLIENSQTISYEEKEFWLDILPTLSKENTDKLLHIIMEETRHTSKLEDEIQSLIDIYCPKKQ